MSVVLNLSDEEAEALYADIDGIISTAAESEMSEYRRSIRSKLKKQIGRDR